MSNPRPLKRRSPGWSATLLTTLGLLALISSGCPKEDEGPRLGGTGNLDPCEILRNCDGDPNNDNNDDPPDADLDVPDDPEPAPADVGDDAEGEDAPDAPEPDANPEPEPDANPEPESDAGAEPEPDANPEPEPDANPEPEPEPEPEPPNGCAEGAPCPTGLVCDRQANACVECTGDQDCAGLRVCNVSLQVCVDCFSTLHCPGLSLCDERTNDCVERPSCEGEGCTPRALCTSSDDCADGHFCTIDGCQPEPPECGQGRACPEGQFCFGGQCEVLGCSRQSDCGEDRQCDVDIGVCVDCTEDAHCGDRFCLQGQGICRQCREDRHCPSGFTCDLSGVCQEPEDCQSDAQCLGERTCQINDDAPNVCVGPACAPDAYEPNNNVEDAAALLEGDNAVSICGQDEDWFLIPVEAGDGFVVQIRYNSRLSNLQSQLLDNNDDVVEFFVDNESLGFIQVTQQRVEVGGTFKFQVEFVTGDPQDYTITYIPIPGGFCLNDGAEPSNTPDQSSPLSIASVVGQFAKICEADEDWYTIDLTANQSYVASIFATDQPVAFEIVKPDRTRRVLRDTSPQRVKIVPFRADETGVHFVRVFPVDPDTTTTYEVNVNAQ